MAQKWNLQDIVPPDRARRNASARPPASPPPSLRQAPPREMYMRPAEVVRTHGHATQRDVAATRSAPTRPVSPGARQNQTRVPQVEGADEMISQEDYADPYAQAQDTNYDPVDSVVARLEVTDGKLARMRKYIFAGVVVALIGFLGISVTVLLSGADVTVKPKIHETTIQAVFEAKLKPAAGELGYELLTLEEEGERQVVAKGKEEVTQKAEGEITVYNGFTATPQKLVKNTRFEAPGGLIYRISDGITVPGYKKDAVGGVAPGTVKVRVIADGTGENYNIADVRLSIPGLKGSEQYDAMYAEVGKVGISGGFAGTKFIIDENELATVKQKLHTELRDKLLARIGTERPNGFVAYGSAVTFVYDSLPATDAGEQTAIIKERARLMVPLFNEITFASFIAKSAVPGYGGEPVRLMDPAQLTFNYENKAHEDISTLDSLIFALNGTAKIVWKFDQEALKKDLLGSKESNLLSILGKHPSIDRAQAVIRPIWKGSFPNDPEEITVTEVVEMDQ